MYYATRDKSKDRAVHDMIDNLKEALEQLPEEDRNCPEMREKVFVDTFGKDGHGRMRCMPRGMTPTIVYGKKTGVSRAESVAAVRADLEAKMDTQRQEMEIEFDRRLAAQREADRLEMDARLAAQRETDRLELAAQKEADRLELAAQKEADRLEMDARMEALRNELLSQIRR